MDQPYLSSSSARSCCEIEAAAHRPANGNKRDGCEPKRIFGVRKGSIVYDAYCVWDAFEPGLEIWTCVADQSTRELDWLIGAGCLGSGCSGR